MRTLLLIVACSCVGVVFGALQSWREFSGINERFDPDSGSSLQPPVVPGSSGVEGKPLAPDAGAKVTVVNGETHDFGATERGGSGAHEFMFKNEGHAPLRIQAGGTSCSACTVSSLPKSTIEPGEVVPITVKWTPSTPDPEFRKEAYILTSDPGRPTVVLVVKGRVVEAVRLHPTELTLGSITTTSNLSLESHVLCNTDQEFTILGHEFTNPDIAEHFEVAIRPFTSAELEREQAKFGFAVSVRVKPGLPLGTLLQTIRLRTNRPGAEFLELPVRGQVVSDISILSARNFDANSNILTLGIVKRETGAKVMLPILIKGPHRNDVELSVTSALPAQSLQASLGAPKSINEGAVRMIALHIQVPPGASPVSLMGGTERSDYGKIVIGTTHPEAKELQILVRFAVE